MKKHLAFAIGFILLLSVPFVYPYLAVQAQPGACNAEVHVDKYTRDDDFDGYPDFLEEGAGYKTDSDDCLDKMKCGKLTDLAKIGERKNILIILDASGSMSAKTRNGKSRMEVAKEALISYINILPDDARVGLIVYSAKGFKGDGCSQIKLVFDIQKINKQRFISTVQGITESGQTPMAASIQSAAAIFEKYPDDDNHIILLSDGEESCNGNPVQEAYNIRGGKGKPQVDVIGLFVSGHAEKQLKCMAEVSRGKYHGAGSGEDIEKYLKDSFFRSRDFYKTLVCLQRDFNTYLICENTKFNKCDQWIIRKEVSADGELKAKLAAAREAIVKRNSQIQKLSLDRLKQKAEKLDKDTKEQSGKK